MPVSNEDEILELKAEVKEVKEDGTFTGVASVYDVEDLTGDVIERGAFKKTISEMPQVPVLWQHMRDEVIGQGSIKEWQNKVLIEAKLDIEGDPVAQKAYGKIKRGLIKGLSVGFKTIKATFEELTENGATRYIRHIQELKLYEVSVVTFPALPAAQVTRVKSAEAERRLEVIEKQVQALQAKLETTLAAEVKQPEPEAKAEEPPQQKANEPEASTRGLVQSIDQALQEIRTWN